MQLKTDKNGKYDVNGEYTATIISKANYVELPFCNRYAYRVESDVCLNVMVNEEVHLLIQQGNTENKEVAGILNLVDTLTEKINNLDETVKTKYFINKAKI